VPTCASRILAPVWLANNSKGCSMSAAPAAAVYLMNLLRSIIVYFKGCFELFIIA
jgi:hypothetical protein